MRTKAFTLIELLVVISIIALLSSVVLASLTAAREKGRLASMRQFAAQVDHVAGEQATGLWDFDECSSSSTADRSGFGGTGAIGAGVTWSTDTPATIGCSLSFNGTAGAVTAGNSTLSIVDQMTLSIWMKSAVTAQNPYAGLISKDDATNRSWKLGMSIDGTTLRFDVFDALSYGSLYSSNANVTDGKWHHIVGVYDAGATRLYIDGRLNGTSAYPGGIRSSTAVVQIGNDGCCGSRIFNGLIDGAHVFSKPLTAAEVGKLYAEGAARRGLAAK